MCDDRLAESLRLADGLFEYGYRIRGTTAGVDIEDMAQISESFAARLIARA